MNINIPRNTFVEPGQSRQSVVQKICDIIISNTILDDFNIEFSGAHPTLYILGSESDNLVYKFSRLPSTSRDSTKIRTCEMRLAFRYLQDAGYYIFTNGWDYTFSTKPQRGLAKAERQEFKLLID